MELSSLDVRALALELRDLEDGHLDKVNQTGPDEFTLKVRHPTVGTAYLLVRPGEFVARVREPPASPDQPSNLAMALRKHLVGARIRRIEQYAFDRVLRFHLDRRGEPHEVVVELFGKGNVLVAGPDGRLLVVMRTEAFAHRTVKRGEPLVFPPARANPLTMGRSDLEALTRASEKDLVRFLALDLGLGGDLAEETAHRSGLPKSRKASSLAEDDLDRLWSALRSLLDAHPEPAVVAGARGVGVQSVTFTAPLFQDVRREPAATLSEAILRAALRPPPEPSEDKEAARLQRQIQHQERGILELEAEAQGWERRGHLAYAHYAVLQDVLHKAKAAVEADGWGSLQERHARADAPLDSWLRLLGGVDAKRARIVVNLDGQEIPLDPLATLEANATLLYDEGKRLRAKAENAKAALADARRRLAERPPAAAPAPARPKPPAKRFWFEAHRWFYTSEGFLVVGGRDAAGNERLVKRHLAPGDRYFHADIHGAPSVILKTEGREPGPASVAEAGAFAAAYSRAFAQFATADAYWVRPEQVSKTAESGEYVPRGSFIVRGQRTYTGKQPLELALGVLRLDAQGRPAADGPHARLVGGPPGALRHHTTRIARVERGDRKPTDAAKELAPLFGVTIDEAVAALPSGTLRIVSRPEVDA